MNKLWRRISLAGVCVGLLHALALGAPSGGHTPPVMAQGTPTVQPPPTGEPTPVVPPPVQTPVPTPPQPQPLIPNAPSSGSPINPEELTKVARGRPYKLNFEDADIKVVAKIVSEMTGRTILLDQKAQGKITIISDGEVTPDQAWNMFKQALAAYDLGIMYSDGVYRVVPMAVKKQHPGEISGHGHPPPPGSGFSVALVMLRVANAEQVANIIKPLASSNGYVAAYQTGNTLVISDESDIVRRLLRIVKLLDVQNKPFTFRVYQPVNIRAKELAEGLKTLFPEQTTNVKSALFESIQAVVVSGPRDLFPQIDRTVAQLDSITPVDEDKRDFFVYYLQNADASDMAKLLSKMISPERLATATGTANIAGPQASASPGGGNQPNPFQGGPGPGATGMPSNSNPLPSASASPQQQKEAFVSNQVSADTRTNSLIFYVTPAQYGVIQHLVAKLDSPGRQVFVSAVVGEMDLTHIHNFGINWQLANAGGLLVGQGAGLDAAGVLQLLSTGGFVLGGVGSGTTSLTSNGTTDTFPNVYSVLNFLFQDTFFNTLSSPRILTQDNQPADISVSTIVPFATGEGFNINGQPIINFDYREVGLLLKVTPHISQAHHVRMELSEGLQEIQSFQTEGSGAAQFSVPIVSKRQVDTTVTVMDGQTIVIGGLVQKSTTQTMTRAPLLSDLPLIGQLFTNKNKNDQKTTLMIFLTPHIVESPEKLGALMEEYRKVFAARDRLKAQMDAQMRRYGKKGPHQPPGESTYPTWQDTGPVPSEPPANSGNAPGTAPSPYFTPYPFPAPEWPQGQSGGTISGGVDPPTSPAHTATYRNGPESSTWGGTGEREGMVGPAGEHTPVPAGMMW